MQVDNLRRLVCDDYGIERPSEQSLCVSVGMLRVGLNLLAASLNVPLDDRNELITKYLAAAKAEFTQAAGIT